MKQQPQKTNGANTPLNLSEDTIRQLLDVQKEKLKVEVKQAEIAMRELDHNQRLADKSIEAQLADRKDERKAQKDMQMHRLVAVGLLAAALLAFMGVALFFNKDAVVQEMLKLIAAFAGGVGAGEVWRRSSSKVRGSEDSAD